MGFTVAEFFSDLQNKEEQQQNKGSSNQEEKPVEGSLLDLCRKDNRGTTLLRPIVDEKGIPMRCVDRVWDVYESFPLYDSKGVPITGEDGTIWRTSRHTFVMDASNYVCQLTPDQLNLHNNLMVALDRYDKLVNEDEVIDPENDAHGITTRMRTTFRWKMTFFWAKVLSLTVPGVGCTISDGAVRLCRHHGSSFRKDFADAIANKTAMKNGDGSWQDAFFNRNTGDQHAVLSCVVTQQQGFKNALTFEENGPNYNVTDKDISVAVDLNGVGDSESRPTISGFNALVYPEAEMRDLYNRISGYLNKFKNDAAANMTTAPTAMPQASAPVQPQMVQQPAAPVAPQVTPVAQMIQATTPVNPVNPLDPTAVQPVQPQVAQMMQATTPVQAPVAPQATPAQPVVNAATTPVQPQVAQPVVTPVQPVIPGTIPVI